MRRRFYFMTELCVAVLYKFLLIIMSNSVTIIVYIEKGFIFILLEVFEMADEITVYDCKSNKKFFNQFSPSFRSNESYKCYNNKSFNGI